MSSADGPSNSFAGPRAQNQPSSEYLQHMDILHRDDNRNPHPDLYSRPYSDWDSDVIHEDDLEDIIDRPVGDTSTVGSGPDLTNLEDQDAETVALSRLRCTSIRTEEIADREKQKKERREQRQNRCADYPGLAFGSAAFGSETMMK